MTNYPAGADAYTVTQSMADPMGDLWSEVEQDAQLQRVEVRTRLAEGMRFAIEGYLIEQGILGADGGDIDLRLRRHMAFTAQRLPLTDREFALLAISYDLVQEPSEPDGWSF